MNREIKFRGFSEKHNQWVYGYYVFCRGHHYILQAYNSNGCDERWEAADWIEVVPESVGQYTGQRDNNEKEIYEGDIIDKKFRWAISFKDCAFYAKNEYSKAYLLPEIIRKRRIAGRPIEVVGNVYENPELITEK